MIVETTSEMTSLVHLLCRLWSTGPGQDPRLVINLSCNAISCRT
jgi:hypothetical protein